MSKKATKQSMKTARRKAAQVARGYRNIYPTRSSASRVMRLIFDPFGPFGHMVR